MPKLRVLSGKDVVKIFESLGFFVYSQKGSHVKLRRIISDSKQTLTIPMHKEIDRGTLKDIFDQASQFITEQELKKYFYTN